jgi:hypothetical protein
MALKRADIFRQKVSALFIALPKRKDDVTQRFSATAD